MWSFNVMQSESEEVAAQLAAMGAGAGGADTIAVATLETRKALLGKRMAELMHLVDSEQLTMEQYIAKLQERVTAETALYRQLKAAKRTADAKRVGVRVKAMATEIKGAQEAGAAE